MATMVVYCFLRKRTNSTEVLVLFEVTSLGKDQIFKL